MTYYNEIDPFAVAWLRALIAAGHLPPGDVDERSIVDVRAADLAGYDACHFFAGIGGWPLALMLAGWPAGLEVWSGSCPCQPFSSAGAHAGTSDRRHLWPVWAELIAQCRPGVVLGEQVEAAIAHDWLDSVRLDLEHLGYAFAPVSLCAASVGAFHIRQRLYFVADSGGARPQRSDDAWQGVDAQREAAQRGGAAGCLDDTAMLGRERHPGVRREAGGRSEHPGFWCDAQWLECRDGARRPVEPGTFPLALGVPARVGRLRAYGNALVPQVAAEVIAAYLDVRGYARAA